jgi:hypothetical protein
MQERSAESGRFTSCCAWTNSPCWLPEKPLSSSHCRLSQAVSSGNGSNGVSQPTARHRGNTASTANGHAKGCHCLTGVASITSLNLSKNSANAAGPPWKPGWLSLPLRCSHPLRRSFAGSRHPCLVPAMAHADLLIDSVRAGAEGNKELFRRLLGGLVSEWYSVQQHVATLPGGAQEKPPKSHATTGACDNLSRLVALIPRSLRTPTPPQPRVPTPQRRRAAARQRGAAGYATITVNTPFLANPRPARPHPGHRWPCSRSDRPLLLL